MKLLLALIVVLLIAWLLWRFASKRHRLPCPTWLAWMVEMDNPFVKTNRAASIIDTLDLKEGMVVLDAGCGPGRVTIPLAKKLKNKGHVVAMDIQQGMLDKTKEKATAEHLHNITYLKAALGDNQLEKEHFDRILLVTVLGEIPNQEAAMKELFDALKPEGILSITEIIFDPHFQTRKSVLKLATLLGLQQTAFYGNVIAYTMHLKKPAQTTKDGASR